MLLEQLNQLNLKVFWHDLEKEFGVTNPTMTVSIKSMQKKGLIDKVKSEKDGRYYRLLLTETGKKLYPKCMAVYTEVEAMCDSILTNEEKDQFIK
ncbi:MarR family winged helix-turn-helix transcriptional regulator, partial [Lactobacillus nasalidis]|uniref:MarR family winged helix-turn-helix transcriptional regulator n=2 Tax=Lactobacillus nasalidis TaxID=2797258 RepID=UPI001914F10F